MPEIEDFVADIMTRRELAEQTREREFAEKIAPTLIPYDADMTLSFQLPEPIKYGESALITAVNIRIYRGRDTENENKPYQHYSATVLVTPLTKKGVPSKVENPHWTYIGKEFVNELRRRVPVLVAVQFPDIYNDYPID